MLFDFFTLYCISVFTYFVFIAWPVWQHHLRLMKIMLALAIQVHRRTCENMFVWNFLPCAVSPFRFSPFLSPTLPPRNVWYSGRCSRPPIFLIYPIICIGFFKEPIFQRNPPICPMKRTYSDILHFALWSNFVVN